MLENPRRLYRWFVGAALVWAVANALWAYLVRHGDGMFRLETASIVFAGLLLPCILVWPVESRESLSWPDGRTRLGVILVIAIWLGIFLPLTGFPFLSDDYVFLGRYQSLADVPTVHQFFRPVFGLLFFVLSRIGGGSPVPFHAASLLLHIGSACLVAWFAQRIVGGSVAGLLAFSVFLLSPVQPEAVLWIAGLQELLWAFLTLAALRVYVGAPTLTASRIAGTTALVGLALLSKETAVCSVPLLVGVDAVLFRMKRGRLIVVAYVVFGALLLAYLFARANVASVDKLFVPQQAPLYFLKQLLVTPYRFFIQPWSTSAVDVPDVIACAIAVAALVLVFVATVVRGLPVRALAGPVVMILATLPLLGYFFVGADLRSARYLYFPAVGWSLLAAHVMAGVVRRRFVAALTLAGVVIALSALLLMNLRPWRVAADVIAVFETGVEQGRPAAEVMDQWEASRGLKLDRKDGLPVGYQGVSIFLNGYPEFERIHRAR